MNRLFQQPCIDLNGLRALSSDLAGRSRAGDVILLIGDLGSGKTTFARAFIQSLGVTEDVPSPTFTLLQTYEGRAESGPLPIYHFDLYRLERPQDLYELDFEDALDEGVSLIEWPEVAMALLPEERLEIRLEPGPDAESRAVTISGSATWAERLQDIGGGS